MNVRRIVSGGQTGVDRGALDAAISLGIEHGGWCPRGRLAEDGRIPDMYHLKETNSTEYWVRTERNVIDSDGTLIIHSGKLRGGTELTFRLARKHDKPCLLVDLQDDPSPVPARGWIAENRIEILNVAGLLHDIGKIGIRDEILLMRILFWIITLYLLYLIENDLVIYSFS